MSDKKLKQTESKQTVSCLNDAACQEVKAARQEAKTPSPSMSRTALATKNAAFGLVGQVVNLVVAFASRTVFIYVLGEYYLGVNYLFVDILNVLSFAELGFGSAMTFALYSPVAKGQSEKVQQLIYFYRNAYRVIAFVVLLFGLALLPFLQYLVSGAGTITLSELRLYFLIFLANTVISYFVTYKFGLLNALQKTYVQTNFGTITTTACSLAQIAALVLVQSFLVYLLANFAVLTVSRFVLARYLNDRYPILKNKPENLLPKSEKRKILHEVKGLAVHQFSGVAVHATDSIIIAAIPALGIVLVGAVGNYNMIIMAVQAINLVLVNSVVAGFGNLAALESKQKFREVFDEANFIGFWVFGLCTVCFFVLLPSFIELWIGETYLIDAASFTLILVNFYLQGLSVVYNNARIAKGNFNKDKWWSLLQAVTNLVVSVVCALQFGLVGVFVGTVVSRLVFVISRPCSTYRFLFGCSPRRYFVDTVKYCLFVVLAAVVSASVTAVFLSALSIANFCLATIICLVVTNVVFFVCTFKSSVFHAVVKRVSFMVKPLLKRGVHS